MKRFNQIFIGVIVLAAMMFFTVNLYCGSQKNHDGSRPYQVEINRIQREISENGLEDVNLDDYSLIKNIEFISLDANENEKAAFFSGASLDYSIRILDGIAYRFDYSDNFSEQSKKMIAALNISMAIMTVAILSVLIFIRINLLKPFNRIKNMPYDLSKGNLVGGIGENKNKFFGRFVWGLNLLKENLEEQKEKELSLQKEKKTLILSISHDIKTPLSAIKLYAKALSINLYETEEKKREIAENIGGKADEIEAFVGDIIKASTSDFLNIQVENGEFYLENLVRRIDDYYSEKLQLIKTEFHIGNYNNCLIKGDADRAVEVIQNIVENAIKYGDGKNIFISFESEEDCALVTVENSGCTLPQHELTHIFDSFWRGSNVGTKGGSGLGLYICRQILRKMDGEIFAKCDDSQMKVTAVLRMV